MNLPDDIWIEILKNIPRRCDLNDLKLVNKQFKNLIENNKDYIIENRKLYLILKKEELKMLLEDLIDDINDFFSEYLRVLYGYNGFELYCNLDQDTKQELKTIFKTKIKKVLKKHCIKINNDWYIKDNDYYSFMVDVGYKSKKMQNKVDDIQNFGAIRYQKLFSNTFIKYLNKFK
jgi:hypothetical protein